MEKSTTPATTDIVQQNRLRPFIFGILSLVILVASTIFLLSIKEEGGIYTVLLRLMQVVIPWILLATTLRCFQAAFISCFYIRVDEEGICLSIPLYYPFCVFLPYTNVLKRNIRWGNFHVKDIKVKAEGQLAEERLISMTIKNNNYTMKTFPFVESAEDIYDTLQQAQNSRGSDISQLKSDGEMESTKADMTWSVNTDYFWKWYKIIGFALAIIATYLLINDYNGVVVTISFIAFALVAFFPYMLSIIDEIDWSTSTSSKFMRFATFCSGGIFPLVVIFVKSLPQTISMVLFPCTILFLIIMSLVCSWYLRRSIFIWGSLAILTSGISNCVLSVQDKVRT
ncbi:hypothetical protein [Candidatus Uabimicrobium amorphum]|uniref:Uncharacterized protein n=1 Tax=Uabimicrobium amorphum TaxID=2596890 RepID=A0A5S9F382_UABAM|nr:hypothetical protein [Candidatus Uabimicrobium amorphum]BBM84242.1 hypothetical protein UABAM_02598 [Candidatus Uabimicrobium amorphum]